MQGFQKLIQSLREGKKGPLISVEWAGSDEAAGKVSPAASSPFIAQQNINKLTAISRRDSRLSGLVNIYVTDQSFIFRNFIFDFAICIFL